MVSLRGSVDEIANEVLRGDEYAGKSGGPGSVSRSGQLRRLMSFLLGI